MSAAAFAGLGLGVLGSAIQARQTSASERRALEAQREMRLGSMPLLAALGLGSNASGGLRTLLGRDQADYILGSDPARTREQQARIAEIQARMAQLGGAKGQGFLGRSEGTRAQQNRSVNNPEYKMLEAELQSLTESVKNAQPGIVNGSELDAFAGNLPAAQYGKIADQAQATGLGQLGRYDSETDAMRRELAGYGDAERKRIEADAQRSLTSANRQAMLALGRQGAGSSSLLGSTLAGNAGNVFERKNSMLGGLNDRIVGQRLNLTQGRSAGRLGLETGLNTQNIGLRTAPLNQQMAILSNIGQSGLGGNSYQPVGGVSPLGVGLQTGGNWLSMYGGLKSLGGNDQQNPNATAQYGANGQELYGPGY